MINRTAILLADGFEEIEAIAVLDILRRAEIRCDLVSINNEKIVKGAHDLVVQADEVLSGNMDNYNMIILPGGVEGADNLSNNKVVINLLDEFLTDPNKYVSAICASPAVVLSKCKSIKNRNITSYPDKSYEELLSDSNYKNELVVVDNNLITSRGPATAMEFAYKIVDVLKGDSSKLQHGMLYNMIKK